MHAARGTSLDRRPTRLVWVVMAVALAGNVLFALAGALQKHHLFIGILWAIMVAGGFAATVTFWVAAYKLTVRYQRYWHAAITVLCIVVVNVHAAVACQPAVIMWYFIADAVAVGKITVALLIQREAGQGPQPLRPATSPQRPAPRRAA